ncbi:MAG: SDR family oxidoreductase [Spirochaetales bacterium]|nr:SDR family oxidoreductase [Spirochaetales bacterium]
MNSFKDKVVIVTGGASGIGRAICRYGAERGAHVILADKDFEAARETGSSLQSSGGSVKTIRADVSDIRDVEALVLGTFRECGRIDYLFNNAGIGINGEFQDMTLEHWEQIIGVNFWGVVYGCRFAYPIMMKQGFGQIVNTASLAGLIPGGLASSYTAGKHAVVGFSLSLRAEARQYGIKINALCPGYFRTNIQNSTLYVSDYMKAPGNIEMEANMKFPAVEDCIQKMMKGVVKNRGIIMSPRRHKVYWLLHRISPEFIPNMFHRIILRMKKNASVS